MLLELIIVKKSLIMEILCCPMLSKSIRFTANDR